MKRQDADIMNNLFVNKFVNQRTLSESTGYSLGSVNNSLSYLRTEGYIDDDNMPTLKAMDEREARSPKNAIILAAGYGMRMVPINTQCPKALVEINNEALIERIITQLNEAGIYEIYVVVGFMKEEFEYLIDKYNIELVINANYSTKNNLHSLALVADKIDNSYIIPCDLWSEKNIFSDTELYSWYMVSDEKTDEGRIRINRKQELVCVGSGGNQMIGIAYLTGLQSKIVREKLTSYDKDPRYNESFWEETLYDNDKMIVQAKIVSANDIVEINTYEQLREIDNHSNQLRSDAIDIIAQTLNVLPSEIVDITILKKGMTNRSFLFKCNNRRYIMRIPGEGTNLLINRSEEYEVYQSIKSKNICDEIVYLNEDNGYKITEYLENSRVCDPESKDDIEKCMKRLRDFHNENLKVNHIFDIYEHINYYESLWDGKPSIYRDYNKTKENVFSLKSFIDSNVTTMCLTHIDAVPDNFLFDDNGGIRLIDWEYAGMQDPHVDIAMFCIYSLYNREQIDNLLDIYFDGKCSQNIRAKIYCYIATCGLLWSNWCEYKRFLGVEFGEYSIRQYRYAKEYYVIASNAIRGLYEG